MNRRLIQALLTLALMVAVVGETRADKHFLTFKTESYCAARWDASTNTFTWGQGGNNPAWVFMAAEGVSGDLSGWTLLHLHVSDFTNASARQLTVVFTMNDGSWPPSGPTRKFVVTPDAAGDINIPLEDVDWGNCDITKIQDLTIYGCTRDDASKSASAKVTDAYYISKGDAVNQTQTITVGGTTRSYRLYVPRDCPSGAPLVIAMHGANGSSDNQAPYFNNIADTAKFIIAYPQGESIFFPVFGGYTTGWDASGEDNADAAFLKAIIDELAANYAIDRKRVYCCGFSNGGMNTYAMTNACSDVFAACASISGFPLNEFHLRHTGRRPVPFLHIHGKGDDFVKYSLMPTIVDEMVARLGANPIPLKTSVSGRYDKSVYEAADGSFPYVYYEIDGMGHNDFTTSTEDGNSSLTMWRFFRQYTLDTPYDARPLWRPRVETVGFDPRQHGWTVNEGTTLLSFGGAQNNTTNQNVYHSLQFTTGTYKLSFASEGTPGTTIGVMIQKLTDGKPIVLNQTVKTNETATLFFKIEDVWGEYQIVFTRENTTDAITLKDIRIDFSSDEELAGITEIDLPQQQKSYHYSLNGMAVAKPSRGIYVSKGKKVLF